MKSLEEVVIAYSEINNTVIGDPELGILICDDEGSHHLKLTEAINAMEKGEEAMRDALDNDTEFLGADFEV